MKKLFFFLYAESADTFGMAKVGDSFEFLDDCILAAAKAGQDCIYCNDVEAPTKDSWYPMYSLGHIRFTAILECTVQDFETKSETFLTLLEQWRTDKLFNGHYGDYTPVDEAKNASTAAFDRYIHLLKITRGQE